MIVGVRFGDFVTLQKTVQTAENATRDKDRGMACLELCNDEDSKLQPPGFESGFIVLLFNYLL